MNDSQVIPEAAVEAAAKSFYGTAWDDCSPEELEYELGRMRETLEAAAPHLLAGAWAEGAQAGFESTNEGFNGECAFDHCAPDNYPPTNPYSGAKWEVQDYTP